MSQRTDLPEVPAEPIGDGALLLDVYRRLVPLHATLTEHGARRPDLPRLVAADLLDVLGRIEASPTFRAAMAEDRRARAGRS
jgi:hypothetical protein